jgi:integrase
MAGEGSIYRRKSDGRWVATISRGPREARQVRTVYRHTRAEAKEALADLQRTNGRLDRKTTVSGFLERWLRDADIRATTRHGYRAVIDYHLNPAIGHLRLASLTPSDVRSMMAGLTGAPKTKRNVLVVLRRALREAVRAELVTRNVASPEYIDAPKIETREPESMTYEETDRVLALEDPLRDVVIVALGTGVRQGELLGLRWQDIGPDDVHVMREIVRLAGRSIASEPKTPTSVRSIPLTPDVRAAFERQRDRLKAAGFLTISTGPVFVDDSGAILTGSTITHRWYRLLEKAGVPRKPWKILRATFLSRLRDAGLDDADIGPLAGHAPGSRTTRRHYIARSRVDPRAALTRTLTDTVQSDRVGGSRA